MINQALDVQYSHLSGHKPMNTYSPVVYKCESKYMMDRLADWNCIGVGLSAPYGPLATSDIL